MTTATDTDLQQIKDLITAGNAATQKQISDLTLSTQKQISDLKEEVRVGFTDVKGDIRELRSELKTVEADLKGDIKELRSELKALDTKFEEKTKNLDLRITTKEFLNRGVAVGLTVTVVGGLLLAFGKVLFFGNF
jgi:predicted  nucleic acid-binding Zn-ribbon protein